MFGFGRIGVLRPWTFAPQWLATKGNGLTYPEVSRTNNSLLVLLRVGVVSITCYMINACLHNDAGESGRGRNQVRLFFSIKVDKFHAS